MLLITSAADPFSSYYGEILRAEGFGSFQTARSDALNEQTLRGVSVAILPPVALTPGQVELIDGWVKAGGNLVAFRPRPDLTATLGLTAVSGEQREGYLGVDTSTPPGLGITAETIQFHGAADLYRLGENVDTVATLYKDPTTTAGYPAVTLRKLPGDGGRAVAFSYDLARSIVLSRQGNPAWAGQDRDGIPPIRPNDLFEGKNTKDFVDLSKAAIPQADEQQRLLANILIQLTGEDDLQVRSWYFPKGAKAVLVLAADDHSPGDPARAALAFQDEQSAPSCSVADWECIRSTSLMYINGSLTDSELAQYRAKGFDFGVHVNTGCRDWTRDSLTKTYTDDLGGFRATYPSQPAQVVNRIHCVAWSDYVSAARIGQGFGLRLDLDYYYWPGEWVKNRPGFFTGSGIPMRFADSDGTVIDSYQAPSQLVNESGMTYPAAIDALLDRAQGPLGYYGAFGTHYDYSDSFDRQLIASGKAQGVPMVSAAQLLTWLDARSATAFTPVDWQGSAASFSASVPAEARELVRGMIPLSTSSGVLTTLTRGGEPVPFSVESIKGIRYGLFTATTGDYKATYSPDTRPPALVSTTPANGETIGSASGVVATFDEPLNCATVSADAIRLVAASGVAVPTEVTCVTDGTAVRIAPTGTLVEGERYQVRFGDTITDLAGNRLAVVPTLSFPAGEPAVSLWTRDAPSAVAIASDDLEQVELGVRFSTGSAGRITGIWLYKGADQLDEHTVTLWASDGKGLATARTVGETTSGWQFAPLPGPVRITPGTTYVASFLAPRGQYANVPDGLATSITNGPLTTPARGGTYRYGEGMPDTASAANYLIDVTFVPD